METSYVSLLTQALIPLFLGAHQSLRVPASLRARKRRERRAKRKLLLEDDSDDDDEDEDDTLTLGDTLLFPIMGSFVLLTLYFVLKYLPKEYIDVVLGGYFTLAGMFAVQSTVGFVFDKIADAAGIRLDWWHLRISRGFRQTFHAKFRTTTLLALPFLLLPLLYIPSGRHWLLSNFLALCLATAALAFLRLDSFITAFALLGALLAYDIFWVFFTPVMVTVAKGIDAPIKLQAPKGVEFAMLGLGDVVVPGLMVALCLRFDLEMYARSRPGYDVGPRSNFSKRYFWTSVVSYIGGLGATVVAMNWQGRAQPALMYLSPACSLGPLGLAVMRGEVKQMLGWRDVEKEEEKGRDETIEKGSEVAMRAREERRRKEAEREAARQAAEIGRQRSREGAEGVGLAAEVAEGGEEGEKVEVQDDSWMENGEEKEAGQKRKPRRRGGKKK